MLTRHLLYLVIGWLLLFVGTSEVRADIEVSQVHQAIQRGIAFLRQSQDADGKWSTHSLSQPDGITALCTLALLESGVDQKDPMVRRAMRHLRSIRPETTYVVSLQSMVFARAGQTSDHGLLRRNVRWLEKSQRGGDSVMRGSWSYATTSPDNSGDGSNTQFAILALHESARSGIAVQSKTWRSALGYWQRSQNPTGSWGYRKRGDAAEGSMTSAGIASMLIIQSHLNRTDAEIQGGKCVCREGDDDKAISLGVRWLSDRFAVSSHPTESIQTSIHHYYYLYCLERVGRVTGKRFFHKRAKRSQKAQNHDWYREGSNYLVGAQRGDGSWRGDGAAKIESPKTKQIGTSFALLFLSKGRRPVLISKLQRPGDDWDRLSHDVEHLTAQAERRWKMPLTWQVIDSRAASAEDYSQTPVLFISGSDSISMDDEQVAELREYVEQGGFIFADSCCSGGNFDRSFRKLMKRVFPESQLALKPLEPEHPIWVMGEKVNPKYIHPQGHWLEGINIGCRTSVVYSPGNLSCFWELATTEDLANFDKDKNAQDEIASCRAVGLNVLAYATNKLLKPKELQSRKIDAEGSKDPTARGHFAVAKLRHTGGCDAAPRAISNVMRSVAKSLDMRTSRITPLLAITDKQLFEFPLVFMHGRHDFRLDEKEVEQLRLYVKRGGMIFSDSICGSDAFATAMRREMKRVFPDAPLKRIPVTDSLLSTDYGGVDLKRVTRRETSSRKRGEPLKMRQRQVEPELEAIEVEGRYVVIFSPYDLSCALERHASPQCKGYLEEDATRIALNVILYSLH